MNSASEWFLLCTRVKRISMIRIIWRQQDQSWNLLNNLSKLISRVFQWEEIYLWSDTCPDDRQIFYLFLCSVLQLIGWTSYTLSFNQLLTSFRSKTRQTLINCQSHRIFQLWSSTWLYQSFIFDIIILRKIQLDRLSISSCRLLQL